MAEPLAIPPRPCTSCPYRRDTPAGVWAAEEYEKLLSYADPNNPTLGVFLCHHSDLNQPGRQAVCRGWLAVEPDCIAVRLAVVRGQIPPDAPWEPVDVPLYESGAEAAAAGMAGVSNPSEAARNVTRRLSRRK